MDKKLLKKLSVVLAVLVVIYLAAASLAVDEIEQEDAQSKAGGAEQQPGAGKVDNKPWTFSEDAFEEEKEEIEEEMEEQREAEAQATHRAGGKSPRNQAQANRAHETNDQQQWVDDEWYASEEEEEEEERAGEQRDTVILPPAPSKFDLPQPLPASYKEGRRLVEALAVQVPFSLPLPATVLQPTCAKVSAEEFEWGDRVEEPVHMVWQTAVPNTASTLLQNNMDEGVAMAPSLRVCGNGTLTQACLSHSCPLSTFKYLGRVIRDDRSGGHADMEGFLSSRVDQHPLFGAYTAFMMRNPGDYLWKMFYDGRDGVPKWDERFVEVFGTEPVAFEDYIGNVFYKWNYFARTLAGDFYPRHSTLNTFVGSDDISRERATETMRLALASPVYTLALERLEQLQFLGLYHRLSESMELLHYTFCWHWQPDDFAFKPHSHRFPAVTEEQQLLMDEYLAIDYALLERAEELFDARVAQMRAEKAEGYVCNMLLAGCAFRCL